MTQGEQQPADRFLDSTHRSECDMKVLDWLDRYDQLISEFLPTANLLEMQLFFERNFPRYEEARHRKLDPDNCRQGAVSCTSGALIVGRWWEKVTGLLPWYVLKEGRTGPQHTLVYLPRFPRSLVQVYEELERYKNERDELQLLSYWNYAGDILADYSRYHFIRFQPPPFEVPQNMQLIAGSSVFLEDRMKAFGNLG